MQEVWLVRLRKIISGGQTGADRIGLDFALAEGYEVGGFCPKGRRAEDGRVPDKYPLIETHSSFYSVPTKLNVDLGDATVIIINKLLTPGSAQTRAMAEKAHKPVHILDTADDHAKIKLFEFLTRHDPEVLTVAGSRNLSEEASTKAMAVLRACLCD